MTLDEAIKHAEEVAEGNEEAAEKLASRETYAEKCKKCAEEHRQLAEWLKELKAYKEQDSDAISRQVVLDAFWKLDIELRPSAIDAILNMVNDLPPVKPQLKIGHCKDCKWWKDSDGLYRRGGHAESQCPINRREVFEGNGYCYMFEPQESEVEE